MKHNYRGSGVSRETFLEYQAEYGGTPVFDRRGEYVGLMPEPFDNLQHQDHDR